MLSRSVSRRRADRSSALSSSLSTRSTASSTCEGFVAVARAFGLPLVGADAVVSFGLSRVDAGVALERGDSLIERLIAERGERGIRLLCIANETRSPTCSSSAEALRE